jgi:hypothetical protein
MFASTSFETTFKTQPILAIPVYRQHTLLVACNNSAIKLPKRLVLADWQVVCCNHQHPTSPYVAKTAQ